ncbi:MAG: DUF72 domain-containing protein [Thermoproteota archaeon]
MMRKVLKIGCCGFAGGLNNYLSKFSLVEVQQTFYTPPKEATLYNWKKKAPTGFEFALKAWQAITHPPTSPTWRKCPEEKRPKQFNQVGNFRPTKAVFKAWESVLSWSKILDSKVIVFQTPPSFKPTKQNISNMKDFFSTVNRDDLILCWEPRGEWLVDISKLKTVVERLNIVQVVDPFWDKPVTSTYFVYFRLHGLGHRYNYSYDYNESDLRRLKTMVDAYLDEGKIVYVLFNNISMLKSSIAFKALFKNN